MVTVSDRAFRGEYQDRSGPLAVSLWQQHAAQMLPLRVVPDEAAAIGEAIEVSIVAGAEIVMTTGGTGIAPRDVTVEATRPLLDYEIPGLAEELRRLGSKSTSAAALSRGIVGVATVEGRRAIVANAPGSTNAVREWVGYLATLAPHLVDQLRGGDH